MGAMRKVGDLIALITVTAMLAPSPSIAEPANLKKRSADLVSKSAELIIGPALLVASLLVNLALYRKIRRVRLGPL